MTEFLSIKEFNERLNAYDLTKLRIKLFVSINRLLATMNSNNMDVRMLILDESQTVVHINVNYKLIEGKNMMDIENKLSNLLKENLEVFDKIKVLIDPGEHVDDDDLVFY